MAVGERRVEGKDELNFAEFPLSVVADRVRPGVKTLSFEDSIFDRSRGETVNRKLTVTGSDESGLPTALDDEVLLGLVQLSKAHQFDSRRVGFSRYQLIQLLNWRDEGKSYTRIEQSLNRWVGVTLYYQNAWWDRAAKCWVSEKFHVLDNVTLFDRDRRTHGRVESSFTWNDVIFRSFQSGNLKSLDFAFYRDLESAIARRLYRFLDKRFHQRTRWEFELRRLACEHVGLSRNDDASHLKRKLRPAIAELEAKGFLVPLVDAERFCKPAVGDWQVIFQRPRLPVREESKDVASQLDDGLLSDLVSRGEHLATARRLVTAHSAVAIREQLTAFDWLVARRDPRVSRNPPGFLVRAIQEDYALPKLSGPAPDRSVPLKSRPVIVVVERPADELSEAALDRFWQSLPADERTRCEAEALASATPFHRSCLHRAGRMADASRKSLLDAYARRRLRSVAN